MLRRLVEIARRERMARVYADILQANVGMQRLCDQLGFTLDPFPDGGVFSAVLELGPPIAPESGERRPS